MNALTDGETGRLRRLGYIILSEKILRDSSALLELAMRLGRPKPSRYGKLIDTLHPTVPDCAAPKSLSARHGLNSLPFHTDGAHFTTPPRYVILRFDGNTLNVAPTLLLDTNRFNLDSDERLKISSGIFQVKNGKHSFYTKITDESAECFRWDEECMRPIDEHATDAKSTLTKQINSTNAIRILWSPDKTLIFDNWRFLHARASIEAHHDSRALTRIAIS